MINRRALVTIVCVVLVLLFRIQLNAWSGTSDNVTKALPCAQTTPQLANATSLSIGFCFLIHNEQGIYSALSIVDVLYKPYHQFVLHLDSSKFSSPQEEFTRAQVETRPNVHVIRLVMAARGAFSLVAIPFVCLDVLDQINIPIKCDSKVSKPLFNNSVDQDERPILPWKISQDDSSTSSKSSSLAIRYPRTIQVDYFINLSSDMFPMHTIDEIEAFLSHKAPASFLGLWCRGALSPDCQRSWYRQSLPKKFINSDKFRSCFLNGGPSECTLKQKDWFDGMQYLTFGDQWVVLHRNFLNFMFNETLSDLSMWLQFFSNPSRFQTPDEWVFQTFANLPSLQNAQADVPIVWQNLGLIIFERCPHPIHVQHTHACYLTKKQALDAQREVSIVEQTKEPRWLFARKFHNVPCYLEHVRSTARACIGLSDIDLTNSTLYP